MPGTPPPGFERARCGSSSLPSGRGLRRARQTSSLQRQFSRTARMSVKIDMNGADLLIDAFERIPEQVHSVLVGLTPDQLTFRVDSEANSIAWLIWHLSRIEDDHIADVAGRPQVWTSDGWARRWR